MTENDVASPPRPQRLLARDSIDAADARRVVAAALSRAEETGAGFAVAVVDTAGRLVAFERADGTPAAAIDVCLVKARTAVLFGAPTASLPAGDPWVTIMSAASAQPLALMPGGLPLGRDGVLVGAVGVGGATPDLDQQVAAAGAEVLR